MEELGTTKAQLDAAHADHERAYAKQKRKLDNKQHDLEQRLKEFGRKKLETAEVHGNVDAADDDLVEVNAGGQIIAAKRSTFTQIKGSRLEALFSGRWDKKLQRDGDGRVFLDVNPVGFRSIVDYLSEMAISSEDDPPALPSADDDHKYSLHHQLNLFGIWDKMVVSQDSNILKDEETVTLLHGWLEENDSD